MGSLLFGCSGRYKLSLDIITAGRVQNLIDPVGTVAAFADRTFYVTLLEHVLRKGV